MNGVEALQALQQGKKVRRLGWGNYEFVYARKGSETGEWEVYDELNHTGNNFIDIYDFLDPEIDDWEVISDWIEDENGVPTCRYCDWSFLRLDMEYIKSFKYCPKCGKLMR
ncbi:hypothetical protein J6V85_02415 [Candidatus Saccharibacteria bacterium]|nr:hypothetical protein [Candidatus Saccharibacteria bacterium]